MTKGEAMNYLRLCADGYDCEFDEAVKLAVAAIQAQIEAEKNDPLTLDELQEMDGKPVWVTCWDGSGGHWAIVHTDFLGVRADDGDTSFWLEKPQNNLAYSRKPEEGAK